MSPLSTREVAASIGIHRATLEEWISSGKFAGPNVVEVGERRLRLWTDDDIARLRVFKAKFYRKGRGRKPAKGK